jgi:hypothetical protein
MLIENWNKIYGEHLYTNNVMYEVCKDTMTVAPQSHTLRLNPVSGGNQDNKAFTIVITMLDKRIACGVYVDNQWNPIEIFDMSKLDLKRIDTFKKLLSAKIQNYE